MVGQVLAEIEEKVAANVQSAGADIAGSRHLDPRQLGDDDKKAARAIRAGAKKKKLRKRRRPILHPRLVRPAGVPGPGRRARERHLLRGYAPPSAESLLQKIEAAKDPDEQRQLSAEYLRYYGGRDDEATRKVRALDRDLKVAERERVLLNRYGMKNMPGSAGEGDDPDAYAKTMSALTAEDAGDLAAARAAWSDLAEKYADDLVESKAVWGWVAQKKLADLNRGPPGWPTWPGGWTAASGWRTRTRGSATT